MKANGAQFRHQMLWTAVFAVAFGWIEAAVVVYIRMHYYPDGFAFPIELAPIKIAVVELVRELATLALLLAFARVAAQSGWGRFGIFAVAFGVWDLVYYAGLYATLGWPESLATWDILFLIPGIWTGPVWAPMLIAIALVVCGAMLVRIGEAGRLPRPDRTEWMLSVASLLAILASFLANHGPVAREAMPGPFPVVPFLTGTALGLVAFVHLLSRRTSR